MPVSILQGGDGLRAQASMLDQCLLRTAAHRVVLLAERHDASRPPVAAIVDV